MLKRTARWLPAAVLGLAATTAQAQAPYFKFKPTSLAITAGTYTPVSGAATPIILADEDEGKSNVLNIGFTFPFNGQNFTQFQISSNGFLKLCKSTSDTLDGTYSASTDAAGGFSTTAYGQRITDFYTAMWNSANPAVHNIVSPFNMDLAPATGALDHFSYEVTGTAPNRVFTMQWKEMKDFNFNAGTSFEQYGQVNFQAKLYETSGVVEFVYGTFTSSANPASSRPAAVGLRGDAPAGGDEEDHMLWLFKGSAVSWTGAINIPPSTAGALTTNQLGVRFIPAIAAFGGGGETIGYAFNTRNGNTAPTNLPTSGTTYTLTPVTTPPFLYSTLTASVEEAASPSYTANSGARTTLASGSFAVDANTAAENIGFTFNYNGTAFTQFVANNNGYVKLGATAPPVNFVGNGVGTGISTFNGTGADNILYPLNFDLTATAGEISVETSGSAPNRVCTIEWKNVTDISSVTNGGSGAAITLFTALNFQVKLYETSNNIEFVYGTITPNGAATGSQTYKQFQVGIRGTSDLPNQQITAFREGGSAGAWNTIGFHRTSLSAYGFIRNFILNRTVLPVPGTKILFEPSYPNDLKVVSIFTLGQVAQPAGNPVSIRALIQNSGQNDYAGGGTVNVAVTGANSDASGATIPAIASGASAEVSFSAITNSNNGANTVTVTLPSDDNAANNTKVMQQYATSNRYSYEYPGQPLTGGVGFTGGTGNFVAGFNTATTNNINSIRVHFGSTASTGATYKMAIWGNNAGQPGTLLYESSVLQVPGPNDTSRFAICPPLAVSGKFFVGVRQVGTQNVGFGYQNEDPVRTGDFYYNSPVALGGAAVGSGSSGWIDFADINAAFRPAIQFDLELAAVLPSCASAVYPANGANYINSSAILSWSAGLNTVSYDVYFGTSNNPPLVASNICASNYSPGGLTPGATYYWRVVGRNPSGTATGCSVWSFTVAPLPSNDICGTARLLTVCAPSTVFGFTNNATQSLPALTCSQSDSADDDVWYVFTATSSAHRITVIPVGQFDAVIDLRSGGNCGTSANLLCSDIRNAGESEELLATGLTPGAVYFVRIYSRLGNGAQGQFNIKVSTDGGWTGQASTDWFSASNWCDNQVPSASSTAVIRPAANQPVLSTSATVNNLTVDDGATVTLANAGVTLNIQRNNLNGGGTLDGLGTVAGPGTVRMSNSGSPTAQALTGAVTVNNISFASTAGTTIIGGNGVLVNGTADIQPSATLTNGGTIRFLSSASGTGRFAEIQPSSTYSGPGTFTVDRYINPGTGRWAMIGAPVQNATLAQWSEGHPRLNPLNNASIFYYQETDASSTYDPASRDTVEQYGWRIPTGTGNSLNPGGNIQGWRIYLNPSFLTASNAGVMTVNGTPYTGDVNVPVSFTAGQYDGGGWNLIANPYASTIDWNNVTVPASVNDAAFVFNGLQYQTYVKGTGTAQGVSVNGATRFLPSSQAFFVKTSASTSITFEENDKTATAASFIREGDPVNQLRLSLRNASGVVDETVVRFFNGATPGFDLRGDAGKLWGWGLNLYTMDAEGKNYTVNSMPEVTNGRTIIPLGVEVYANGTHTISLTELESFPASLSIRLRDKLNNTLINPRIQPSYTFNVTSNPATQGRNRFEIIFDGAITAGKPSLSSNRGLQVWPNPSASGVKANYSVQGFAPGKARVEVIDAMGRLVQLHNVELTGNGETIYNLNEGLNAGRYTLRVISGQEAAVSAFSVE